MKKFTFILAFLLPVLAAPPTSAEDIDLYVLRNGGSAGYRPQLMVIFDNSGSMSTQLDSAYDEYNPSTVYAPVDAAHQYQDDIIYYIPNAELPDGLTAPPLADFEAKKRRFNYIEDGCSASLDPLKTVGRYSGVVKYVQYQGRSGQWLPLPDNSGLGNKPVVDCLDDFMNGDQTNAAGYNAGWPAYNPSKNGDPYTTNFYISNNRVYGDSDFWNFYQNRNGFTLFTANYLRYLAQIQAGWLDGPKSRLEVAKEAVSDIVNTAPGVDFGLTVFNYNSDWYDSGGRVVQAIKKRDNMVDFINQVNSLNAETWTPLCETTYEVMRYLSGQSVIFGNRGGSMKPAKDPTAEDGNGNYVSPFTTCQEKIYVVLITDGEPTRDAAADTAIKALPNIGSAYTSTAADGTTTTTMLPALAGWMHTQDLNPNLAGTQTIDMYTIGFALDAGDNAEPILQETAKRGGGQYFSAKKASDLAGALQKVLAEVSTKTSAFTSPSIAANNFDRTRSLDSIYYAMFLPSAGPRWIGNIKKLRVTNNDDIVDVNGLSAITDSGDISDSAKTYWSSVQDGNNTRAGGVNQYLVTQAQAGTRTLLTNANGSLKPLTKATLNSIVASDDALATALSTPKEEIVNTLDWLYGEDVDDDDLDGSTTDIRADLMGDPLHSKPLAINYGGANGAHDVRLLVGTNQGALHMFQDLDSTAKEDWAFFPYQELPKAYQLRLNTNGAAKIYSMDGSPVAYLLDNNDNGIVEPANGDKVWTFIGQRRGGRAYYGLDISSPDSPSFLWRIDNNSPGMSELGQTWSTPVVAHIPGHTGPVLIFGAGYDASTDSADASTATMGRGIYIIDAHTGALVWSATPAATGGSNLHVDFKASFPNKIGTLDSDADGLVDRLYASDTAGNIWRVDMPSATPFGGSDPWTVYRFASLGGTNATATDRRFYEAPTIVQTQYTQTVTATVTNPDGSTTQQVTTQPLPFDAVLLGTGKRPSPLSTDVSDKLFMLRDTNIVTHSVTADTTPTAIGLGNLYDMSGQPFSSSMTDAERQTQELALGSAEGWFFNLTHSGEKSLAAPLVIDGIAYFTTFTPPGDVPADANSCLIPGMGRLYALDLHHGFNAYSWGVVEIPGKLPDTPVVHAGQDEKGNSVIRIIGVGRVSTGGSDGASKPTLPINVSMNADRIYYYVSEK
ncbi:PilC/PilY family type IV pilus protein [Gallaecimonas kandeliae]|uniref:pilus assembly protein n=1 Tax=Gallaecimonas kandeliae TaxID=3029055 RepID=UPI002647A353|nr:PilC/PilY family type IV pilus protein [Gallaecimonas kandeliae]WKE64956.1 PilC/PilY family type IV pilus protein [Gallaecimonas kandeliae]